MKDRLKHVHPELQKSARLIPPFSFGPLNIHAIRLMLKAYGGIKRAAGVNIETLLIPVDGCEAGLRLRIYRAQNAQSPAPALLWLHGGGFLIGKPELNDAWCVQCVREVGVSVVSVDYRLAPEHPFPIPLQDAYAALKWLADSAVELNIDAARIAIGGDSAGGGLAASLAQLAVDRQEIHSVFQLLIYPMLDERTCNRSEIPATEHILWNRRSNCFGWRSYLGTFPADDEPPKYAVPARRQDLSGLPPAWIGVGTQDLFLDEGVAYAQRMQEQGVDCELVVVPGAFHGFDVISPQAPVTRSFVASQMAALKRYLHPETI